MRRILIIWKIVLVILVVLACVITGLYCCLVKASEADAELERFYNEKYGKERWKEMPKGRSGIITEEFKGKENTAHHDVEKLFKIYRSVNWKMQIKINQVKRHFQLEYGTDVDKFLDSLYQAGMDVDMDLASEKETGGVD